MTRFCYDSITAGDIPANAEMVAGYIDHPYYTWSAADWARFPNAVHVRIAINPGTNDGHVLDVETGDAAPYQLPGWVKMRRAAGMEPTGYVNLSNWQACKNACASAGVAEPSWWVAEYDGNPALPAGAVAKQYANSPITGGHYDLSSVADYWPGVDVMTSQQADAIASAIETLAFILGDLYRGPGGDAEIESNAGGLAAAILDGSRGEVEGWVGKQFAAGSEAAQKLQFRQGLPAVVATLQTQVAALQKQVAAGGGVTIAQVDAEIANSKLTPPGH